MGRFDRFYRGPRARVFFPPSKKFFAFSPADPPFPAPHCPVMTRRFAPWRKRGKTMLSWVVTFLVIALIAGILGFGGIAGVSIEIAKAIFFIAIVLFLISAVVGLVRG